MWDMSMAESFTAWNASIAKPNLSQRELIKSDATTRPPTPFIQEPSPRKNVSYVTPNSTDIYFLNVFFIYFLFFLFYLNNPPSWGQLGL